MIKAALSNILVYYMSLFRMPSTVGKMIEKLQLDFLWEGNGGKKNHLIRWKEVIKPKEYGGLGLGRLKERNIVLLGKWLLRFAVEPDNL